MEAYSLLAIFVFVYCICKYTSIEIMPELKTFTFLDTGLILNMREMPTHSI